MKLIGRSKISKINPKPNIVYPMIRLPRECADAIGMTATIYETEYDGKKAYLITMGQDEARQEAVIKPELHNTLESRVSEVESKIEGIYSILTGKWVQKKDESQKGAFSDGPVRIRTGDLRRVRATS
jgi:hypothetical protein